MIYRGPGFLRRMMWLLPRPPLPSVCSTEYRRHTGRQRKRYNLFISRIIEPCEKAWSSINHSVLSGLRWRLPKWRRLWKLARFHRITFMFPPSMCRGLSKVFFYFSFYWKEHLTRLLSASLGFRYCFNCWLQNKELVWMVSIYLLCFGSSLDCYLKFKNLVLVTFLRLPEKWLAC